MDFIGDILEVLYNIIFNSDKYLKNTSKIIKIIISIFSLILILSILIGCIIFGILLIDKNIMYSVICFIISLLIALGLIDGYMRNSRNRK